MDRRVKHGHCRTGKKTTEYCIWEGIIQRCLNRQNKRFPDWGGRGIDVCWRWRNFTNFFADMGPRPEGTEIERKDNSKGYSPDNCVWATKREQMRNTRQNKFISIDEITLCVAEMATLLNFPPHRVYWRACYDKIDHQAAFARYISARIESAYAEQVR